MRLPQIQRAAWWGGLAFCVFVAIWLLNMTGPPTATTSHQRRKPGTLAYTYRQHGQWRNHYHIPIPGPHEEVDLFDSQPGPALPDTEKQQAGAGEEIQVDAFILEQNRKKALRLQKGGSISLELETYISYKADDSLADGLEVTRCAQKVLWNTSFYKCYKPRPLDKPPFHLTFWSQDYHAAAIAELKMHLEPLGVRMLDKGLSPHCAIFKACGSDLRAVSPLNGIHLGEDTIHRFYAEYLADKQFASSDVFLCIRPSAMCELFIPFAKSLLVIIDTRFELGRWAAARWNQWNLSITKLCKDGKDVVAATSQYDVEYVRFYTGCVPTLLPPMCPHIIHSYKPHSDSISNFLLFSIHSKFFVDIILNDFKNCLGEQNSTVILKPVHHPRVDQAAENLVKHAGIVLIPHAPSSLRMTELYRMNIPIFAPSLELLVRWHVVHGVIADRTWQHVTRLVPGSAGAKMPGKLSLPNPNDEKIESVGFWVNYMDIYMWPNMVYFNNMSDLVMKLQLYSSNPHLLVQTSLQMKKHNTREKWWIARKWDDILTKFQQNKRNLAVRKI